MGRLGLIAAVGVGLAVLAGLEAVVFAALGAPRAVFLQIAGLGVAMALGVVLARNLVHAALYLAALFFLVACLYVLLNAEFLAAMQVLVYIGAVTVLLMFGIMMTRNVQGDETTWAGWPRVIPAGAVALALVALLALGMQEDAFGWLHRPEPAAGLSTAQRRALEAAEMPRLLGGELMTRWVVAFELAGLLLTAALVGAVALARGGDPAAVPNTSRTHVERPDLEALVAARSDRP